MTKQTEILDSAQQLFGRHGLKKVTTDDIARAAHVSKSTIYNLYKNKEEILKDVVQREMAELSQKINAAVAAEETVENRLRAHLLTKINTVHDLINLHNVNSESMAEHWVHAHALQDLLLQEESRIIREILQQGVEDGDLDVANVEVTAHFMVVSLQSLEYPWVIEGLNLTIEDQVDQLLGVLLNGLRKRT
jgi:AcrR family transcriptional regulator